MKRVLNLFMVLVFASPLVFTSCGKDDGGDGPEQTKAEKNALVLNGKWTEDTRANLGIKFGNADAGDWPGFSLTFSDATKDGGKYAVTGISDRYESGIWKASGTWKFDDNAVNIVRDDGVSMALTIPESTVTLADDEIVHTLTLVFTIPDTQSRLSGISGEEWIFHLKRPTN
ncbi:MAG: hypothetical protein GDA42_06375 [Ekhidna sp.]|nr:hypothetical protein [Ekhidna sp.]